MVSIQPPTLDAAVVGAGPAGACAARQLARGGLQVALLEQAELPRYKVCGGGVVGRAWQALRELPGWQATVEDACHAALLQLPTGRRFEVRRSRPVVCMTMRARFDAALTREATAAGAQLLSPCRVLGLEVDRQRVTLTTSMGPLHARYVVAADGVHSRVAQAAGWTTTPTLIPALELELPASPEELAPFRGVARFDIGRPPRGYAWVFPKQDHLSVGILSTLRGRQRLPDLLAQYCDDLGLPPAARGTRRGHLIPFRPRPAPHARHRVLLTGDAAGFADPITCEGISYAIRSGQLAASAILEATPRPQDVAEIYQRELRRSLLAEIRVAHWLARVLYGPAALRELLFRRLGQPVCEAMVDVISGEKTYGEILRRPGNYWRALTRSMATPS